MIQETTMTTAEMLAMFCGNTIGRYTYAVPFRVGGYVYATDGSTCVRVHETELPLVGGAANSPPAETLPWSSLSRKEYPIPPRFDKTYPCESCKGDGKSHEVKCEECNGDGYVECGECGHEHKCEACNGNGVFTGGGGQCEECGGSGVSPAPIGVRVGPDVYVSETYLERARKCGATTVWGNGPNRPVYFTAGPLEGLIMPMNVHHADLLGYPPYVRDIAGETVAVQP